MRSVDTYVLLLRMQNQGMNEKSEPVAQALLRGPLALRNDAAIRYRMRNISAVAREIGAPILHDFSPAESVGAHVRPRIKTLLLNHAGLTKLMSGSEQSRDQDRDDALIALALLRERILDLEKELSWVGHNHPPEPVNPEGIDPALLRQAVLDIGAVESELQNAEPEKGRLVKGKAQLSKLAAALTKWIGERTTKFIDAALVSAAPLVVAKVTGVLPLIVDAIEAIAKVAAP